MTTPLKRWPRGAESCRTEALEAAREIRALVPEAQAVITQAERRLSQIGIGPVWTTEARRIVADVACHAADIQRFMTEAKLGREAGDA